MSKTFTNNPAVSGSDGSNLVRRFTHTPMAFNHNGIQAKIQANGWITIVSRPEVNPEKPNEVEFDEVSIPASLVFRLATLLRATRQASYVPVASPQNSNSQDNNTDE